MIGLYLRENILVTKGSSSMFAKNQNVWSPTTGCLVPEGVFVAENVKTGLSVDSTNIATVTDPIRIGVSLGLGKSIRWGAGEEFYPKTIKSITAMPAKCGTPEVSDLWWECTQCYEDYAVQVTVRDIGTMSYSSTFTDSEPYLANARPDCNSCGDCNPTATCSLVQAELVTELQGLFDENEVKAYVTALYDNSFIYCFKHSGWSCGTDCTNFNGLDSMTVDGNTSTAYTDTTDPASMAELVIALNNLKAAREANADFVGSVFITKGFGDSCCVQLHINTPNAFVLTDDDAAAYTPCSTTHPQTDHANKCGIRVIAAPVTQDTSCIITKEKSFYGREVNIYAASDSFLDATVEKIYSMELPQNFGNFVKYEEYKQNNGGQARVYDNSNTPLMDGLGGINLDSRSRLMNAFTFADETKSYVSVHIEHTIPHTNYGMNGAINPAPVTTSIYMEECNDDSNTSI